jgi:hypothetical protein
MKLPAFVPGLEDVGREALIVIGGALLAALVMSRMPRVKAYIKQAWV